MISPPRRQSLAASRSARATSAGDDVLEVRAVDIDAIDASRAKAFELLVETDHVPDVVLVSLLFTSAPMRVLELRVRIRAFI